MKLFDGKAVVVPMARIVFDDALEFFRFQNLALNLGMGDDWPILMLRDYLNTHEKVVNQDFDR